MNILLTCPFFSIGVGSCGSEEKGRNNEEVEAHLVEKKKLCRLRSYLVASRGVGFGVVAECR